MAGNNPWNDPNVSPPGLSLPVAIGPMTLPVRSPKRRLGWLVALGILMFAAGLLLGPTVHNFKLVEGPPVLSGWLGQANKPAQPGQPQNKAELPAPSPVAAAPAMPPVAAPAVAPTVAPLEPSPPPAPEHAATGHGQHARSGGKGASAPKQPLVAAASTKKESKQKDPFDLGDDSPAPTPAARKGKAPADEPAPAKSPAKSGGGGALDDLMGGVMAETKSKGKKDKDIDALLKDVQKSEPAAAPKREEPVAAEPLSPADISKGMGVVKAKAKACAQSTSQSGIAELKMTVGKNGKVTDVTVSGKLAGSPLGACVERAARTAVFRPNTGLTFDYKVDAR